MEILVFKKEPAKCLSVSRLGICAQTLVSSDRMSSCLQKGSEADKWV